VLTTMARRYDRSPRGQRACVSIPFGGWQRLSVLGAIGMDGFMAAAGALYEAFPAPEAHRILQRLEFHYTPKHASWLNMAEIEISVLHGQCLDRRIGERDVLKAEIEAWERQRNASDACVRWTFTTNKARGKLARAYPHPANTS
jgi:DDE superfamily endonuclease